MTGSELLVRWRNGRSINSVARELRVDNGSYKQWEAGTKIPSLKTALRLQREIGIAVEAWEPAANDSTDERKAG